MQGVAFTIMHKSRGGYGAKFVTGNGFVLARAQKAKARRKTFMHWADDTFRCLLRLSLYLGSKIFQRFSASLSCQEDFLVLVSLHAMLALHEHDERVVSPAEQLYDFLGRFFFAGPLELLEKSTSP